MPVAGPEHQIEAGKNGIKIDFRPEPGRPGSEADGPEKEDRECMIRGNLHSFFFFLRKNVSVQSRVPVPKPEEQTYFVEKQPDPPLFLRPYFYPGLSGSIPY